MDKEFIVLYTSQKQKKAKTWHDGTLKHDGKGTKAMLYDEKGDKLDTIHIKFDDITLGEQLESDRYYILVETVKSSNTTESPVTSTQTPFEERPLAQRGSYSQARCAGLKRKKTGFMPPRTVKQAKVEEQNSQERVPLRQQNRIYPTQPENSPVLGQSSMGLNQRHNVPECNPLAHSFEKRRKNDSANVGENVLDLYSRNSNMKIDYIRESQESCSSPLRSPVLSLSPWSVYGAKKCTPKESTGPFNDDLENVKGVSEVEKSGLSGVNTNVKDNGQKGSLSVRNHVHGKWSEQSDEVEKDICIETREESSVQTTSSVSDHSTGRDERSTSRSMRAIMDLLRKNKQNSSREKDSDTNCHTNNVIPTVGHSADHNTCLCVSNDKETSPAFNTMDTNFIGKKRVGDVTLPGFFKEDSVIPYEGELCCTDSSKYNIIRDGRSNIEKFSIEADESSQNDHVTSSYLRDADRIHLAETSPLDMGLIGIVNDPDPEKTNTTMEDANTVIQSEIENEHNDVTKNSAVTVLVDISTVENDNKDEETEGCFSLSFSPLSHVTLSDSEDITEYERTGGNDTNKPESLLPEKLTVNNQQGKGSPNLHSNDVCSVGNHSDPGVLNDLEPQISGEGRLKKVENTFPDDQNDEKHGTDTDDNSGLCKQEVSNFSLLDKNKAKQQSLNFSDDSYDTTDRDTSGCLVTVSKARRDDSEVVDYSSNVVSLSTQSQDTMEFSCDTLCDGSQNNPTPEGIDSQADESNDRHDGFGTVNQPAENKFDEKCNEIVAWKGLNSGLNAKEDFEGLNMWTDQECNARSYLKKLSEKDQFTKETQKAGDAAFLKGSLGSTVYQTMSTEYSKTGNFSPKMTIYRPNPDGYLMTGMKSVTAYRNKSSPSNKSSSIAAPPVTDVKENTIILADSQASPIDTHVYTQSSDDSVEATDDFDDEDIYGNLYKPRPMYQHVPENLDTNSQKLQMAVPHTRSSLQSYRAKIIQSKELRSDLFLNICKNDDRICLKTEEDMRNTPVSNSGKTFERNHCEFENFATTTVYEDNTENESQSTLQSDPKFSPEVGNCAVLQKEASKWDQYVPDEVEEEIDLQKYTRKENILKDFSVVKLEQNTDSDKENSEDFQTASKAEYPSRKFPGINISKRDITIDKTCMQAKTESESDSLIQKQSCDIDETWSVDSAELLMAAENAEQNILVTDENCDVSTKRKYLYDSQIVSVTDEINSVINSDVSCRKGLLSIEEEYTTPAGVKEFNRKESEGKNNFRSVTVRRESTMNTTENSTMFGALQENAVPSLNDSLDLSLSFEDEADNLYPNTHHAPGPSPVLRAGWKSQVQSLNQSKNLPSEEQVKTTSRCLEILAKSRMSPNSDRKLSDETCVKGKSYSFNNSSRLSDEEDGKDSSKQRQPLRATVHGRVLSPINGGGIKDSITCINPVRSNYKSPLMSIQSNRESNSPVISRPQKGTKFRPPGVLQSQSSDMLKRTQGTLNRGQNLTASQEMGQGVCCTELCFPGRETVEFTQNIARQVTIPAAFKSVHQYKQILSSAVIENLNTVLFEISKRYHQALSRVDMSSYTKSAVQQSISISVLCNCGTAAKILTVRKEGPNKGRQFYGCSKNAQQRCKFFQWAEGKVSTFNSGTGTKRRICDGMSLGLYMKDQHVHLYPECQLIRKCKENIIPYFKRPKWVRGSHEEETIQRKQLFLKLPRKGHFSLYAKDDIWVISKDLDFRLSTTFLARSTFYGPLSSNEVEIEPLYGYSPSNWSGEVMCHGLLAGNASTELNCLENIKEHLTVSTPPVIPRLLSRERQSMKDSGPTKFNAPRLVSLSTFTDSILVGSAVMDDIVSKYISQYRLNTDQTEALRRVSHMFTQEKSDSVDDVLLLHGVFGAGKSFLLSVMVLFLVEVFKILSSLSSATNRPVIWKLLISSTTNVAVDRILQGVLQLGFEDFVRVGSVKKIAKPILPYSIHASGTDNQELKDLQEMLRSSDLTPAEKSHVRQSIEKHRQGENKKKLGAVKVVGVTCASCSVPSLNNMEFPVVFLDECSQMTEPSSLLPIARFGCKKLLLVGDPKQLDPTIEGAKAAHDQGLEQTMFDRLIKMGYIPTILRTQYRCHPWISNISNQLFYGDILMDGVTETDRQPLLDVIPTICFYDVDRGQECCEGGGSFYNEREAQFVVFLLQVLTASGIESQSIGVITLYRSQMSRITDLIATSGDNNKMKGIQVSTVDAFQGGERDIIILSCVRTLACGFIDNDKRTNVALTRAKHHLLIVGHYKNLSSNFIWSKVLRHCQGHTDGVCSADEAKQKLELHLESLSSQTCSEKFETKEDKPTRRKSHAKASKKDWNKKTETGITSPGSSVGLSGSSCEEVYKNTPTSIDDMEQSSSTACGHDAEMSEFRDRINRTVPDDVVNSNDSLDQNLYEYDEKDKSILRSPSLHRDKRAVDKKRYGDRLGSDNFGEEMFQGSDVDLLVFQ